MNTVQLDRSVLVLIDYQQQLMPGIHRTDHVIAEALRVAEVAFALGVPIIGTEQNPDRLGPNEDSIRAFCGRTLRKSHFDACADGLLTALAEVRPEHPADAPMDVVVAGCEAHVCLLQTSLGLLRAGHSVWVLAQACGSRHAEAQAEAMQRLQQAGATLVGFEMLTFEWLQDCHHPRFRAILPLIKAKLAIGSGGTGATDKEVTTMASRQSHQDLPHADLVKFEAQLQVDGFVELQTREIAANTHNVAHAHDFEVRALMLDGELRIDCDGSSRTYRSGDIFTMAAGREHVEQFGPAGARYLVGRKYPG